MDSNDSQRDGHDATPLPRYPLSDRPEEGERGPDCLAHFLVDLQGVPLHRLDCGQMQAWLGTVCELLAAWKRPALPRYDWVKLVARKLVAAFPGHYSLQDVELELKLMIVDAAAQWERWKAVNAPEVPVRGEA